MEFSIKNIILYDAFQSVSGFVEFKIRAERTDVKVRHNLCGEDGILLSVVTGGDVSHVFSLAAGQCAFELKYRVDPEREIFVCIIKYEGKEIKTLASGILNQDRKNIRKRVGVAKEIRGEVEYIDELGTTQEKEKFLQLIEEPIKPVEVNEVDEVLRKVCTIDENGKGQCETCPYRDHFYQFNVEHQPQGKAVGQDDLSGKQILVE